MRMTTVLHGLLLAASLAANRASPAASLAARDALTGAPLHATVEYEQAGVLRRIGLDGRAQRVALPSDRVDARVSADGHRTLAFTLDPAAGPTTLLLDPLEEPAAYARLAAHVHGDARWLAGYVRRADDGIAIAGALVTIEGRTTQSDDSGYFEIELAPYDVADTARPSLHVRADGIGEHVRDGLVRAPGVQRLIVVLGSDVASSSTNAIGALDAGDRTADGDDGRDAPLARPATPAGPLLAPGLAPPATIRVGYADAACTQSCCTASCSHNCVLSLETYVRRGLDSEWIASWNTQSLRAGSIAYRSYGAWRVAHPINGSFDICSSACCQVNDSGTASSTDNAIARTPGLMLTRNGSEAASAEYSAENNSWDNPSDGLSCSNNDLSCGDGFAGSPANNWPCLADSVGAGHGCFGHGRGMSQWGTQRWGNDTNARLWPWIVDHYYNDNGAGSGLRTAVMTSPLSIANVAALPAVLAPGATLHIAADATNTAGATHAHLLVGASLYRSGVGYVDDSAHDAALSLDTGTHAIGRDFHVPAATPAGSYDLLVSLYLDVDENGAITTTDLPLALVTAASAVQLADDRIFADGFEG